MDFISPTESSGHSLTLLTNLSVDVRPEGPQSTPSLPAAPDPKARRPTATRRRQPTLARWSRSSLNPKASRHRSARRPHVQVDSKRPARYTTGPLKVTSRFELLS